MRPEPRPFELYRHFKGNLYQIMAIAHDAGDGGRKVVYQALYGDYKVYVRDLAEFMSETDHDKYPRAGQQFRFERVEKDCDCDAGQERRESSVKTAGEAIVKTVEREAEKTIVEEETKKLMSEDAAGKDIREKKTEGVIGAEKAAEKDMREKKPERAIETGTKSEEDKEDKLAHAETTGTPETTGTSEIMGETDETAWADETAALDPAVVAYLDAEGYEERLNILTGVHHRITAEMLATMAVVSDIELEEGSVEEQYQSLKYCLATKQKFEKVRLF